MTRAIDLLRSMGYHEAVSRSMVILNDSRNNTTARHARTSTERFAPIGCDGRIHAV